MTLRTAVLAIICVVTAGLGASAQTVPAIIIAGREPWKAGVGRDKGAQLATLFGNPKKRGLYVFRVRIPAGFVFTPHVHDADEFATVLSGKAIFGSGPRIDRKNERILTPGAFARIPAGIAHYWIAKTDTVLQASGEGPRTTRAL